MLHSERDGSRAWKRSEDWLVRGEANRIRPTNTRPNPSIQGQRRVIYLRHTSGQKSRETQQSHMSCCDEIAGMGIRAECISACASHTTVSPSPHARSHDNASRVDAAFPGLLARHFALVLPLLDPHFFREPGLEETRQSAKTGAQNGVDSLHQRHIERGYGLASSHMIRPQLTLVRQEHNIRAAKRTFALASLLHLDQASHAEQMSTCQSDRLESNTSANQAGIVVQAWQDWKQHVGEACQQDMWQ